MTKLYKIKSIFLLFLIFLKITLNFSLFAKQEENQVLIYAPISLSESIKEVVSSYEKQKNDIIFKLVLMGTSQLVLQIKNGATPDIFISANEDWMNYLQKKKKIDKSLRKDFLYNSLVLITNKNNNVREIKDIENLKKTLINTNSRLSLAMTKAIPAGIYAKNYLQNIGVWNRIKKNYVESMNVRVALNFVARNELEFGIVYKTEALNSQKVKVIYNIESEKHKNIVYPLAALNKKKETLEFYNFLLSKESLVKFSEWGFSVKLN
jgi:molybdate transport system substrate-binding protein